MHADQITLTPARVAGVAAERLIDGIAAFAATASFEMSAKDLKGLDEARPFLSPGTTVSISWLPNDTDAQRVAAARAVRDAGLVPLPHIAARRIASLGDCERLLDQLENDAGVDRLFVVAGDLPEPAGPYGSSLELLSRTLRNRRAIRRIGFAAYPEPHPAVSPQDMEHALDTKLAVAADCGFESFVITQFAFDAAPIARWLSSFRNRWNDVPVRVGLAGPANIRTLLRFARVCGISNSTRAIVSNGASIARLLAEAGPDPVIRSLIASTAAAGLAPPKLHLFPFGGLARTAQWIGPVARRQLKLSQCEAGFRPLFNQPALGMSFPASQ